MVIVTAVAAFITSTPDVDRGAWIHSRVLETGPLHYLSRNGEVCLTLSTCLKAVFKAKPMPAEQGVPQQLSILAPMILSLIVQIRRGVFDSYDRADGPSFWNLIFQH